MRRPVVIGFGLGGAAAAILAARLRFYDFDGASGGECEELGLVKRRILSRNGIVPGREEQKSVLLGSSLEHPLDLLVVGGGATGSGVVLDAATRGLSVGLLERDDFSSGTSSRSTKLLHGGICFYLHSLFSCFSNSLLPSYRHMIVFIMIKRPLGLD